MTTQQVAEELGVSVRRVQAMIVSGRLRARKVGRSYTVHARDVERVRERKPGWRKGVSRNRQEKS